jgi:hypothetical protein
MAKEKSIVEEAIIQMKNLEEAVAENAKGILASTMKEEIKELVKESLSEQEDEIEMTDVDMEEPEMETDDEMDSDDMEMGMDMDTDDEEEDMEEPIDLTDKSDEEVLRVFQLMGPDDNIIVTKDDAGNINLKDDENEYMIVGESDMEEEFYEEELPQEMEESWSTDESIDDIVGKMWDDEDSEDEEEENPWDNIASRAREKFGDKYDKGEVYMDYPEDEEDEDEESYEEESEGEEIMYEIEMSEPTDDDIEPMSEEDEVMYEIEMSEEEGEEGEEEYEEYNESLEESKKGFNAKGKGMGKPKFSYNKNPNQGQGFKVVKKSADKTMGTGNAKKVNVYKDKETLDGEFKHKPKKVEANEASRTLGSGKRWGRKGLNKPKAAPRHLKVESVDSSELQILREKNEEYRKALNVFRNKLNEVAVFNSNLAYATRLFTEHSTSKQEKINILKRFDGVETIKESKNLYKTIKDELSTVQGQPMNESIERKIESAPATGSAVNLIESKTYENPQFLRMKDLMAKLK